MSRSFLDDAFAHHVWATLRLVDACLPLSPQQLETTVPGTYGSILETQRHLVGADSWYLFTMTGERAHLIDEGHMSLAELRATMEANGAAWSRLLGEDLDPDAVLREVDADDGYQKDAPMGIRLAPALHHGSDHRSQICTTLTTLGVQPPAIDVWDFRHTGWPRRRGPTHVLTVLERPTSVLLQWLRVRDGLDLWVADRSGSGSRPNAVTDDGGVGAASLTGNGGLIRCG